MLLVVTLHQYDLDVVRQFQPHILYLHIGVTDVGQVHGQPNSTEIANDILAFAMHLAIDYHVHDIVIGQLCHRHHASIPYKVNVNNTIDIVNRTLKAVTANLANIHFWSHSHTCDPHMLLVWCRLQ